jgi:hypothetical protein
MNYDNYDCRIRLSPTAAKPAKRKGGAKHQRGVRGSSRLLTAIREVTTVGAALFAFATTADAQVTIQPVTEAFSKDGKIYVHQPTSALQSDLSVTSPDVVAHFLSLLQFDLSSVPYLSSEITSATITLYTPTVTGAGTITMSPILDAWRETSGDAGSDPLATYNAFFGTTPTIDVGPVAASTAVGAPGFYTWDVTDLVKSWIDNTGTNNGVLIQTVTPGGNIVLADVDSHPGVANSAPSLTVVPEPGSAALAFVGATVFFARRRRQSAL